MLEIPEIFNIIKKQTNTSWKEMYEVFNMGHRMEIYTDIDTANEIIQMSKSFNVDAQIIGRCESSKIKKLTIKSEHGEFVY